MNNKGNIYFDKDTGKAYTSAIELINAYIVRFSSRVSAAAGKEITFKPLDEEGYSFVVRGSATVGINVVENRDLLLLLSRIMKVPTENKLQLYQQLLELNYSSTSDGAFALDKETETVYLRASRSIAGLDYEEFENLLHSTALVADDWDDKLKELFGDK